MSIHDAVDPYATPCERCGSVQFMHHKNGPQCDSDLILKLKVDKRVLSEEVSRLYQILDALAIHLEKHYKIRPDWNTYTGRLKIIKEENE